MNQRDLELLSSYLDGQLKPSDSARLESRLSADPNLRAVLNDLRAARGLLRSLPMRKSPRNFRLTPKMVGKNPPLPRAYPVFRFVTALATLLLFLTVGLNVLAPQLASQAAFGRGGGGGDTQTFAAEAPAATEAPATEAPATEAPALEPSIGLAPLPTTTLSTEEAARTLESPTEKIVPQGDAYAQSQPEVQNAAPQLVPSVWQVLLAGVAVAGAVLMFLMRRLAMSRWRRKG